MRSPSLSGNATLSLRQTARWPADTTLTDARLPFTRDGRMVRARCKPKGSRHAPSSLQPLAWIPHATRSRDGSPRPYRRHCPKAGAHPVMVRRVCRMLPVWGKRHHQSRTQPCRKVPAMSYSELTALRTIGQALASAQARNEQRTASRYRHEAKERARAERRTLRRFVRHGKRTHERPGA